MTVHSLIIAVAAGALTGVTGRLLAGRRRTLPTWLPVAAGVAAAVLATVLALIAGSFRPEKPDLVIILQVLFAAVAVAAVVATADRKAAAQLPEPTRGPGHRAGNRRLS